MKEKGLRKHAECTFCGGLVGEGGAPSFWAIELEQHGLKMGAIKRQDGLAAMLGGNSRLAQMMGADEEMTVALVTVSATLCEDCALGELSIVRLAECAQSPEHP